MEACIRRYVASGEVNHANVFSYYPVQKGSNPEQATANIVSYLVSLVTEMVDIKGVNRLPSFRVLLHVNLCEVAQSREFELFTYQQKAVFFVSMS